ncbi:MAG TPA: hypothetical protein VNN21_07870, partial [Dehalococcoidia bacterium]|nr:hypothetical protein [Dehalococcoidia bacterium]
ADMERKQVGEGGVELLDNLRRHACQSLSAAGDALSALSRVLRDPPLETSPGGIGRDVIESASAVRWLCDPECGVEERIQRIGSIWLHDLDEMRKLLNVQDRKDSIKAKQAKVEDLNSTAEQIEKIRERLLQEGAAVKCWMGSTDLVKNASDMEFEYRLWSNLSHGNPYALQTIRDMHASGPTGILGASFHVMTFSVGAFSRALVAFAQYFSPGKVPKLKERVSELYDRLGIAGSEQQRDFLQP